MTYQVLARKWRPKRFADLVGQEHVVKALVNALDKGRLHHAYLLTGTRGVGKTTIARILAKSLNCPHAEHGEPCGRCESCLQIDAGRYVDVLEIDAASNTGIDNIREVLENAQYAPTMGKYKVYIIDEVHMLSKSAFNAMLKTLEEPPEHVKFILATTDPQKVPITVLSRCLQFVLRNLSGQQVHDHLAHVLQTEHIDYEDTALHLLGRAAAGSMRDALSLLDQAIAIGSGKVTEADVRHMIGAVDKHYLYDLLAALAARDGTALMAKAAQMASRAIGFDNALSELAMLLQRLALLQAVPKAIAGDDAEHDTLRTLAVLFSGEQIQLYYQCALRGKQDLPLAPDEYTGFTMTLLRMLAFAPMASAGQPPQGSISGTQLHDTDTAAVPDTAMARPPAPISPVKNEPAHTAERTKPVSPTTDNQPAQPAANEITARQTALQRVDNAGNQAEKTAASPAAQGNNVAASADMNAQNAAPMSAHNTAHAVPELMPPLPADTIDTASAPPPWDDNSATQPTAANSSQQAEGADTGIASPTTEPSATPQANTADVPAAAQPPVRKSTKNRTVPPAERGNTTDSPPDAMATPERLSSTAKADRLSLIASPAESHAVMTDSPPTAPGEPAAQANSPADTINTAAANVVPAVAGSSNHDSDQADDDLPHDLPALTAANWVGILAQLAPRLGALQLFTQHTAITAFDDQTGVLTLALAPAGETTADKSRLARLAAILSAAYGRRVHVHTQAWQGNQSGETPAMYQQRRVQENRAEAQQILENDATAQALISTFSATWVPESLILKTAAEH